LDLPAGVNINVGIAPSGSTSINDTITSLEEAKADMCSILKVNPEDQKFREYTFKPYFTSTGLINGRCLKNGNQYLFFEPMEALSME
jgi:hypothetical protein